MQLALYIVVGIVAFLHLYFLYFEMFAWTTKGPKIFKSFPRDLFEPTQAMAANQGLYNGFLAAGLIWTYFIENAEWQLYIALFFFGCVAVAGLFGTFTASRKIFFVQAVPALFGIGIVCALLFGQ